MAQEILAREDAINTETMNREADLTAERTARTNAIADEKAARINTDNTLSARIDALSTLPAGSTSGDAELIDARTGYDGISYANAGTAIRRQVSHLHGITNYSGLMKRTYFITKSTGIIANTSGVLVPSAGSFCTEYIPVNGIVNLSISKAYSITGGYNICWYDKNKNFISGQAFATLGAASNYETLYPPENAAYIVISNQGSGYSASDYVESPFNLEKFVNTKFEKTFLTDYDDGYYLNLNGAYVSNSDWYATIPVSVYGLYHLYMPDSTALRSPTGINVGFYHQNQEPPFNLTYVCGYTLVGGAIDSWGVVPENATHIIICQPKTKKNSASYIETLSHPWTKIRLNNAADIYDFLKAPIPFSEVEIAPGTYDLYTAGFAADIMADEQYYPYMHDVIIHGNGAILQCNCPSAVVDAHLIGANACSIINEMGSVSINDLTLNASNIRYALHSECQTAKTVFGSKHLYRNVKATNLLTTQNIESLNGNAIGVGASRDQLFIFDNCEFNSTGTKPAFYIHGRTYNFNTLIFNNCIFNSGQRTGIVLSQYTGNGIGIPVKFNNCFIGDIKCVKQGLGENYDYQFIITSYNSYITDIYAGAGVTFIEAPRRINTISGTIDTSYSA